ncbi:hypothetical protein O1611_g4712 [Lasiodiplodia mahajangana]|uniref:Uncharacterized protein n=1 Tax=Lasiodiplodia mahajangana TaxID=1108764 RepID=A0ACC2JNY6_9PEZI|nr:hypothetical protein O1611_g4712 [Lasiodiplodia mahajangana]
MGNIDALDHDSDSDKKHLKTVYEKRAKRQSAQEERKSLQAKRRQDEEAARAADAPQISGSYGTVGEQAVPPI